ncbi:MAG: 50S ribosomal protein L18Ae [Thermoplasmatota archaeon]
MVKAYRVEGTFYMKNTWQPFKKEVVSEDEGGAREKVLSLIGSNHKVKRKMVRIENVVELSVDDVENLAVRYQLER